MIKKDFNKSRTACKATFSLPKEAVAKAQEVCLLGDFNDWDAEHPLMMKKQKDGSYATTVKLEAGRKYEFRYLIDRDIWENDWNADDYIPNAFGDFNSVVVVEKPAKTKGKTIAKTATKTATAKKTAKPKATKKDNLKKIEGIGPKIEKLLKEANIKDFNDLAKADIKVLEDVLKAAGPRFKMHKPMTWSEQALLADAGKWEELDKLQAKLKAGRRK